MSERGRGPGVAFPPPLIFAAAFFIGWVIETRVMRIWPVMAVRVAWTVEVAGWVFALAGLVLAYWGMFTFTRRRTAIYPNRDASTLVIEGPYRFTRNPMYSGMILAYTGGCGVVSTLWPMLLLPFAVLTLYFLVIKREEKHLTEAFGDSYRDYQRRVGRWF